jgi:hypothetical protein
MKAVELAVFQKVCCPKIVSNPPQISDLRGFAFEKDDIESLKNCKPGDGSGGWALPFQLLLVAWAQG